MHEKSAETSGTLLFGSRASLLVGEDYSHAVVVVALSYHEENLCLGKPLMGGSSQTLECQHRQESEATAGNLKIP